MANPKEPRWALVGSGSGGLGRAIAKALATDGWNVAVAYNSNREGAEETARRVEAAGGEARQCAVDLGDPAAAANLVSGLVVEVPSPASSTPPGRGSPTPTSPSSTPASSGQAHVAHRFQL